MDEQKEIDRLRGSVVKHAVGPTIILGSGTYFDFCDPDSSEITIEDIAYGLGYEGRFSGQCYSNILKKRKFFATAQHCVLGSYAVEEELRLQALWHEAGEAVCGDMSAPLKSLCPDYKVVEKRCESSILRRFKVVMTHPVEIKVMDVRLLMTERRDLTNWGGESWSADGKELAPYDFRVIPWTPDQAAKAFLERHKELTRPGYKSKLLKRLVGQAGIKLPD